MQRFLFTIIVIMTLFLTACEPLEDDHLQVGNDEYELVIEDVKVQAETLFDEHPDGMQLLIISIQLTNQTEHSLTLTPSLQFYLEDEFLTLHDSDPIVSVDTPFVRSLPPCESVSGELAFFVPIDSKSFTFIFEPSINEPARLRIDFTLDTFLD